MRRGCSGGRRKWRVRAIKGGGEGVGKSERTRGDERMEEEEEKGGGGGGER